MKKLSKQATIHLLLQGMYKGLQEAKKDPLVQEKYPKGLDFIEGLVIDLGKRAKNNPNFTLSKKQVKKLNQFLSGSSGVLSAVLRRHIVMHCKGNQCTMVSPNEFRFEYVEPPKKTFQVSGEFAFYGKIREHEASEKIAIPVKSYEKLSDFLEEIGSSFHNLSYKRVGPKQKGVDSSWETVSVDGDRILWESELEWDYDYFQSEQINKVHLTIYVNGNQVKDKKVLEQGAAFYRKKYRTM
jgi:hypothetical protein